MTSHAQCQHPAEPAARQSCRMMRRLAFLAEKRGLTVEWVTDNTAAWIMQMWIKNPNREFGTKLLVTGSARTPSVAVCHIGSPMTKVAYRRAYTWMDVISI